MADMPVAEECFNDTADVIDTGREMRRMMRELELKLSESFALTPGSHKIMKSYFLIWDALEKELEIVKSNAERRSAIQRLGGR